jgi:ribulose-phosphate 3-epimerase
MHGVICSQIAMTRSFKLSFTFFAVAATKSLALRPLGSPDRIIVSPSVAKADFLNLGADLQAAVDGGAEWLHFSVQDGRMVPKISFGAPVVASCRKAFPNTIFDVKLGCIEPEARVDDFIKAGADILSVHPEATLQLGAVIHKIDAAGVAPGVVLNPGTSISAVEHVLDQCQVAVVMLVSGQQETYNH